MCMNCRSESGNYVLPISYREQARSHRFSVVLVGAGLFAMGCS